MENTNSFLCPVCGKESAMTVREIVNLDQNPELWLPVRNGSIFETKCEHCHHEVYVKYPFLYHQPQDKWMIHFLPSTEGLEPIKEAMTSSLAEIEKAGIRDYTCRIVVGYGRFIEKLRILDMGWDDRIIEIMKLNLVMNVRQQHPDVDGCVFMVEQGPGEKGNYLSLLQNGKEVGNMIIEDELYDTYLQNFWGVISQYGNDLEIHANWAINFLKKYCQELRST